MSENKGSLKQPT